VHVLLQGGHLLRSLTHVLLREQRLVVVLVVKHGVLLTLVLELLDDSAVLILHLLQLLQELLLVVAEGFSWLLVFIELLVDLLTGVELLLHLLKLLNVSECV
jgi:hypothetical protein